MIERRGIAVCKCGAEATMPALGWRMETQPTIMTCPDCITKETKVSQYDADYFLRGKETGRSLYTDYHWMPELTLPMVRVIADHLCIDYEESILDFGCACGYTVKAFRELGYRAFGIDISKWAIQNCDELVRPYVNYTENSPPLLNKEFDWIIAKDVLEHVSDVVETIGTLMSSAKNGLFIVVPLASNGGSYTIPEYEKDITHIHRLTLSTWAKMFMLPGWIVEAQYRLKGVKDNYAQYPTGNGFLTVRRQHD